MSEEVESYEGFIKIKSSKKSFFGKHTWDKFFASIDVPALSIRLFKSHEDYFNNKPLAVSISLKDLKKYSMPDKKKGSRFDIVTSDGKLWEIQADSEAHAVRWVHHIEPFFNMKNSALIQNAVPSHPAQAIAMVAGAVKPSGQGKPPTPSQKPPPPQGSQPPATLRHLGYARRTSIQAPKDDPAAQLRAGAQAAALVAGNVGGMPSLPLPAVPAKGGKPPPPSGKPPPPGSKPPVPSGMPPMPSQQQQPQLLSPSSEPPPLPPTSKPRPPSNSVIPDLMPEADKPEHLRAKPPLPSHKPPLPASKPPVPSGKPPVPSGSPPPSAAAGSVYHPHRDTTSRNLQSQLAGALKSRTGKPPPPQGNPPPAQGSLPSSPPPATASSSATSSGSQPRTARPAWASRVLPSASRGTSREFSKESIAKIRSPSNLSATSLPPAVPEAKRQQAAPVDDVENVSPELRLLVEELLKLSSRPSAVNSLTNKDLNVLHKEIKDHQPDTSKLLSILKGELLPVNAAQLLAEVKSVAFGALDSCHMDVANGVGEVFADLLRLFAEASALQLYASNASAAVDPTVFDMVLVRPCSQPELANHSLNDPLADAPAKPLDLAQSSVPADAPEELKAADLCYRVGLRLLPVAPGLATAYADFLAYYAHCTISAGRYYDLAVNHARRTKNPEQIARALLAFGFFKAGLGGDVDGARVLVQEAMEVLPSDPMVLCAAAQFAWQVQHDYDRADSLYLQASKSGSVAATKTYIAYLEARLPFPPLPAAKLPKKVALPADPPKPTRRVTRTKRVETIRITRKKRGSVKVHGSKRFPRWDVPESWLSAKEIDTAELKSWLIKNVQHTAAHHQMSNMGHMVETAIIKTMISEYEKPPVEVVAREEKVEVEEVDTEKLEALQRERKQTIDQNNREREQALAAHRELKRRRAELEAAFAEVRQAGHLPPLLFDPGQLQDTRDRIKELQLTVEHAPQDDSKTKAQFDAEPYGTRSLTDQWRAMSCPLLRPGCGRPACRAASGTSGLLCVCNSSFLNNLVENKASIIVNADPVLADPQLASFARSGIP